MSLYDDARALDLVSMGGRGGPYVFVSEVEVLGLDVVSMSAGLIFYGVSGSSGPGPGPEGQLARVYPGMARVYPGVVRVYPL